MASKVNRIYKCPFCNERHDRASLVSHIADNHDEELPDDFSPFRYVFHYVNKKPLTYHGICTECKGPTPWDEERGRYKRQCGKKKCHDSFVKKFEDNMVKTKGVTRISATSSGQVKMLQNRKISGYYTFQNGKKKGYVGSYEKSCLEFMDKVLNVDPNDVLSPGPILEYTYEGKTHIYITDFYYQPYNLIIEVKDGGNNPNNRNMPEYRAKQIKKEEFIIKNTNYNYIRLTNNDLSQLLKVFIDLRMSMNENTGGRVVNINEGSNIDEAMSALMYGSVLGLKDDPNATYITNYMMKPDFIDPKEHDRMLISKHINFDEAFCIEDGKLSFIYNGNDSTFNTKNITKVYRFNENVYKKLSASLGKAMTESEMFELAFNKKLYTMDQIAVDESFKEVLDYNSQLKMLELTTASYLLGSEKALEGCMKIFENDNIRAYKDLTMKDVFMYEDKRTGLVVGGNYNTESFQKLVTNFFDCLEERNNEL